MMQLCKRKLYNLNKKMSTPYAIDYVMLYLVGSVHVYLYVNINGRFYYSHHAPLP